MNDFRPPFLLQPLKPLSPVRNVYKTRQHLLDEDTDQPMHMIEAHDLETVFNDVSLFLASVLMYKLQSSCVMTQWCLQVPRKHHGSETPPIILHC